MEHYSRRPPELLYHKDIGFPPDVEVPATGTYNLNYGNHARVEAIKDRYGQIALPQAIDIQDCDVIEIGLTDNRTLKKMLVRASHDSQHDICIVFHPSDGFVRTVWLNHVLDKHHTLDASKYQVPATLQ